ncbi:transposase [Porticoccaceae bacterium]|nr:transposase [Porticoccaceae bacterium]
MGQKTKMTQSLAHGEIPLDNNLAENAIRPYVLGRKAWLFWESEPRTKVSAKIYSLMEISKESGK